MIISIRSSLNFYFAKNKKISVGFFITLCFLFFIISIFLLKHKNIHAFVHDPLDLQNNDVSYCLDEDKKATQTSIKDKTEYTEYKNPDIKGEISIKHGHYKKEHQTVHKVKRLIVCLVPKMFELDNKNIKIMKEDKTWYEYLFGSKESKTNSEFCSKKTCWQNPDNKIIKFIAFEQATQKQINYFKAKQNGIPRELEDAYRKELKLLPNEELVLIKINDLPDMEKECLKNICNSDRYSKEFKDACSNVCPKIEATKVCECETCASDNTFKQCYDKCTKKFRQNDCLTDKEYKQHGMAMNNERQKEKPNICYSK